MSIRRKALVATGAVAVGLAGWVSVGSAVGDHHDDGWWRPPPDVRRMLDQVDSRSLQRFDHALVGFGTRHTLSTQTDPTRGIGAARDYIKQQFDQIAQTSGGRMTVALEGYDQPPASRIPVTTRITDVVATLKGTDPQSADRVYIVGAHYDSRITDVLNGTDDAPGANDDGSGTSAVLELARVMAPRPTEATIVFVAYAGEEQGLYGSNHLAEVARQQGWNIQGVLNMDIIGSPVGGSGLRDDRTIRLFSEGVPTSETAAQTARRQTIGGENDGSSRQLARYVKETGENDATDMRVKLVWRRDRFLRSGDQVSFLQRGWAGVRFTEPFENFDHQHQDVRVENGKQFGDLEQFVDFRYLARVTRVIGSSLAALARSPRAPVNARMLTADLGYDTTLRWNANPEPDVVGYEVVWRDSTEALWTNSRRFGNVTEATIPNLNKDDYQVGVRAIDRDGNKSPVAYPIPANA
ncbi:M28 family metallopeptidase [Solirubrobacter ginsenosidimutans]|uniref:M28 family metallopeptidase n=1 Tax=Solirubrobacter ginsenosidimutans TaxID=490573 RepID=A0A9X3MVW9_9ACTN|nr:M28 family metallopeptidase [Solirubrobacter ginsenosidimutans]MDA0162303.1 M28 family metallopeptidase [Solirubrobacter ginsenosidimutans]